ncbi:MAG: orotate phosphoribosyltransferase [Candidatus Methanoperedens sp.]|nr:orotate phosphoribosyltransferase [Candidatus Methanoperedens sp.]
MESMGVCSICGRAGKLYTCMLCGRTVCSRCITREGVCTSCSHGRAYSASRT